MSGVSLGAAGNQAMQDALEDQRREEAKELKRLEKVAERESDDGSAEGRQRESSDDRSK